MTGAAVVDNLARVRQRMADACARADRSEDTVRLVAVSKRIALPLVVAACRAGQWDLGENRVVEALDRQEQLPGLLTDAGLDPTRLQWHFIGHLQRNKATKAAGRFCLLHGVDSLKLARRLSDLAASAGRAQDILLEVNIAQEAAKHGFAPAETVAAIERAAALPGINVTGLMGMARHGADEPELRATFASLRRLAATGRTATGLALAELSMGMSGDFEAAIAEGATLIRVGGAIFGPRQD
jgi:pyridoxal phosphate enzyme (YggS family)